MKNLWVSTEMAYATWRADLSVVRDDDLRPALAFAQAVFAAGERHEVLRVTAGREYERERDGAIGPWLARVFEAGALDWFAVMDAAMLPERTSTAVARLAHYGADGAVVESACADVGALLDSLDPGDEDDWRCEHYPPVRVQGRRVRLERGKAIDRRLDFDVRFELHSDIWFPWIHGVAAQHGRDGVFDNRELARRHTPRLNAFFADVARAAEAAGGTFALDRDPDATGSQASKLASDRGIQLDAPPTGDIL